MQNLRTVTLTDREDDDLNRSGRGQQTTAKGPVLVL